MKGDFENLYHEVEKTNFWFKARRKYILDILKNYPKNMAVLDIGCSSGILLNELKDIGFEAGNLYGVDISEKAINNCRANGIANAFVMDAQDIQLDRKFDIIIASDCLEHLEDDRKALANWADLLKPNGILLVFVPAFKALWSEHDEVNMHFRRYVREDLEKKIKASGLEIEKSSYWNLFLFFPVFLVRLLSRLQSKRKQNDAGDLIKPGIFNNVLFNLINFENKLLKYINFPIGVSTFCITRKPALKRE